MSQANINKHENVGLAAEMNKLNQMSDMFTGIGVNDERATIVVNTDKGWADESQQNQDLMFELLKYWGHVYAGKTLPR